MENLKIRLLRNLIQEMKKYRADESCPRIQEWELLTICREIELTVSELRKESNYEMSDEELKEVQWAYAYLKTRA